MRLSGFESLKLNAIDSGLAHYGVCQWRGTWETQHSDHQDDLNNETKTMVTELLGIKSGDERMEHAMTSCSVELFD